MTLLPQAVSEIVTGIENTTILIYGRAKIGKSTLASKFPNPIFLATEAGLRYIQCNKVNITSWEAFLEVCAELSEGKHEYKTIVIDTIDNLATYCADFVLRDFNERVSEKDNVVHIADIPHGKGWMKVTYELDRVLSKVAGMPYGLVMISHSDVEKVETKSSKYDRMSISITGKGSKHLFLNMSDIILFIDSDVKGGVEERVIRTKPSRDYEAGDRSGKLPATIGLDYNELEKYLKGE